MLWETDMCHLISKAKAGWGPWMGGSIGMPGVCRLLEEKKKELWENNKGSNEIRLNGEGRGAGTRGATGTGSQESTRLLGEDRGSWL